MKGTLPVRAESPAPTCRIPCLVVVRGSERGRIISIGRASVILGRARGAGIQMDERGVSRQHARFQIRRGKVSLQDLGSTNGTWCNGRRVQETCLKDGDQIQFGACLATFRLNHPDERRLFKTLYYRATRDALTGLLNRTSLEDRLNREVQRQKRYGRGLAVIQLDLDRFKAINDAFGHATGDAVLKKVALCLQMGLRGSDLAARMGGEEFVLVLPECGRDKALAIAEKIRRRVAALKIKNRGKAVPLSASLGVSAAEEDDVAPQKLLAAADHACYRAKRTGRNRVC
jgi:two-component system cell cycle response regulator